MAGKEIDMLHGPVTGKILRYTLPLILSGLLQLAFNAADTIVVGRYAGGDALAAVGSTGALINLITNLFLGLGIGVSVSVAHAWGASDWDSVSRIVHTALLAAFIGGAVVFGIGFFGCRTFLTWMGSPDNVIEHATLYMRIYFIGMPAMLVYNFCASALRASGDTKHPTAFLVAGGVLNVILNLITVIAFGLGVAGVAIATVASQCLSASLTVGYLFRIRGACRLSIAKLRLDRSKLLAILRVGIPAGLQSVAFSISNVLIQSSINSFGSLVMEGNAASANLGGFIYVSMNAFCHAAMAFVGQNVGARLYERLRRIMTACIVLVTVIGLAVGWGVYLFREPLIYLYRPGEAYVLEYGTIRLSVIATTYFLCGIVEVVSGALRGMGSSVGPTAISLIGICVLRIVWIETAFRVHRTLYVLYLSYPLSWIATILMLAVLYYIRKRRLLRGAAQTEDGERRGEAEENP